MIEPLAIALLIILIAIGLFRKEGADRVDAVIRRQDGEETRVHLEVANSVFSKMKGLMGRETLEEDGGMLFSFRFIRRPSFWMFNTPLSLDIIFLSGDGTIVDIRACTVPGSLRPISPSEDCRHVLELSGGYCGKHGVQLGDMVRFVFPLTRTFRDRIVQAPGECVP
jgi:uncharacterized membrane protein (UPF0127 family)